MDGLPGFSETDQVELDRKPPIKIVYLYSDIDKDFYGSLCNHIIDMEMDKLIEEIPDLRAGALLGEEHRFQEAQIIIPLLSSDFLADDKYNKSEVSALIKKRSEEGAYVWPIMIRHCRWERSVYYRYDSFLEKDKERVVITDYPQRDVAYKRIADKMEREVRQMLSEQWVQDGNKYYYQMCLAEAIAAYNNSLSFTPDYPPAFLGKWRTFRKMNRPEEAKPYFDKLFAPDTPTTQNGKDVSSSVDLITRLLCSLCKGRAYLELGQIDEAHTAFQEVCQQTDFLTKNDRLRKLYAEAHCGEGDAFLQQSYQTANFESCYSQAISYYYKATKLDANNPIYPARIAKVHIMKGCRFQSLADYEQALLIYQQLLHHHLGCDNVLADQKNTSYYLHCLGDALAKYEEQLKTNGSVVDIYGEKGYILLALKNASEALSAFKEALRQENENAYYHYGKGRALAALERYQDAFASYQSAWQCHLHQSADFLIHYAATQLALGKYEEAFAIYRQALINGGNKYDCYLGMGKAKCAAGGWDEAIRAYYNNAVFFAQNRPEPYLERARAYVVLGKYDEASADLDYARRCCNHPEATFDQADIERVYGDLYSLQAEQSDSQEHDGLLEKARVSYLKAIDSRAHYRAYIGLAYIYSKLENFKEAIEAFDHAADLKPLFGECYFVKGQCYEALREYYQACSMYEQAIASDPNEFYYQQARGNTLIAMRKYKKATTVFEDIINHSTDKSTQASAYCGKGVALHERGEHEKALQCFLDAADLDSSTCSQSRCQQALDDIYSSLKRLLAKNPQDVFIYRRIGDALILRGRFTEARDAYTSAIEHGDVSTYAYCRRGYAYEEAGGYQDAYYDYDQALQLDRNCQWAREAKERVARRIVLPQKRSFKKMFFG